MAKFRNVICAMVLLALAACAHERPLATARCALDAIPLHVGTVHPRAVETPFQRALRSTLVMPMQSRAIAPPGLNSPAPAPEPPADELLVLSGGSQHGLFGTGFFLGMKQIPTYRVVTGVSTGALQSTFLFLANQPEPKDRVYPDDLGPNPGDLPKSTSNVTDLAIASSISHEASLLKTGGLGTIGALKRGAVGSLEPLRQRIYGMISVDTLHEIAQARREGRLLLVGVTDADSSEAYAIDMTELASRVDGNPQGLSVSDLRHCYADVLIASSSVPLAAFPVTLDFHDTSTPAGTSAQHLFIDGGVRYGVFLEQLRKLLNSNGIAQSNVTLVVNGSLYAEPWTDGSGQPVKKWSALSLGLRAVGLLENQAYRYSVDAVERYALQHGQLRMAFISNENIPGGIDPDMFKYNNLTCKEWSDRDNQIDKPVEFHAGYMQCLMQYGKVRGEKPQYNYVY